jgi:cellulose synthase/poly-beta-1,6-N-acetylglucosamine synthase-like glycosyltransferase
MDVSIVILVIISAFVGTQALYLGGGLLLDWLLIFGARHDVRTPATDPSEPVSVLVALYREPRSVLEETLSSLAGQDYPLDRIEVVLVHEADDPIVTDYVDDLVASDDREWELSAFAVDSTDEELHARLVDDWPLLTGKPLTRTKGLALTSALHSLPFDDDRIVTVFDADTVVDPDLFALAVAGLEEYDVVQAKQTVRNIEDGILPKLESMGMAAWSHVVYPRTARGPYQLLGKGYFMRAGTLRSLRGWEPNEITEDMSLGVAAYQAGLRLGVLDSYVQDLCPSDIDDWVTQKRRWLGGPYRILARQPLSPADKLRLMGVTMLNQAMTVNTVLGLPAGVAVFALVVFGYDLPLWVDVLATVNLVNWAVYSALGYRATRDAVRFESARQKVGYYLLSNPLTQSVYALVWTVPLALAVYDELRGAPPVFEVTPKAE